MTFSWPGWFLAHMIDVSVFSLVCSSLSLRLFHRYLPHSFISRPPMHMILPRNNANQKEESTKENNRIFLSNEQARQEKEAAWKASLTRVTTIGASSNAYARPANTAPMRYSIPNADHPPLSLPHENTPTLQQQQQHDVDEGVQMSPHRSSKPRAEEECGDEIASDGNSLHIDTGTHADLVNGASGVTPTGFDSYLQLSGGKVYPLPFLPKSDEGNLPSVRSSYHSISLTSGEHDIMAGGGGGGGTT
jgi:hypothetical protein